MPLQKLPYKRLERLIGVHLSTVESPETVQIIVDLSQVRKRGYLTKRELVKVCRWKSPRVIQHVKRNRAAAVEKVTKEALAARSEEQRLLLLTGLHGVSVPMASSILTLTNPKRYGVIDVRAWQLLYEMGAVETNPKGAGFTFKHWVQFLKIIRSLARNFNVRARDIERTLFLVHQQYQKGLLYGRRPGRRK